MKIGIVTTWFERGAAYVSKQIKETIDKEHDVYIYARGGEATGQGNPIWDKDYVTWGKELWLPTVTTPIEKKDFLKWIKGNNIECVIFNEQHWLYPVIWCQELGIKTIAYVDYYKESTIRFFAIYDFLICNTKRHYEVFKWHKGAKYIPWGTDLSTFKRRELPVPAKVFFHSAGMAPFRKGTDILLKAFHKSERKWKLVIHTQIEINEVADTDLSEIIEELQSQNKLEIIFKSVPAPGLYYMGSFYIYPSRLDGIGLTVAEAMACGLIPVVTDNPPMNEFVPDNFKFNIPVSSFYSRNDGYYWPISECDVDKLTKILDCVSSLGDQEINKLQDEIHSHALENLSWEKNSAIILDLLDEVQKAETTRIKQDLVEEISRYSNSGLNKFNRYIIKYNLVFKTLVKFFK